MFRSQASPLEFYNSETQRIEQEDVYGAAAVRFLYATRIGGWIERVVAHNAVFSSIYGWFQNLRFSRRKIEPFIERMGIDRSQFVEPAGGYAHFNAFFTREFRPGVRVFDPSPGILPAFAEARYLGWEQVGNTQTFPVKGRDISARELLGDAPDAQKWAERFTGGPVLIARLCPVDYHRYHYPVAGRTLAQWSLRGRYHSVNPLALHALGVVFSENVRRVAILETPELGRLAMIEVGATGVGRIVQTFDETQPFGRGEEKGHFLFGGSTVILLGEPGHWKPSPLILEHTAQRREVWLPLGGAAGTAFSSSSIVG